MEVTNRFALKLALSLTIVTLFFQFSSAGTMPLQKVHVYLENSIYKKDLFVHCKSKDDDLGVRKTLWTTRFEIEFKVNLWGTTRFTCDIWWTNDDGKKMTRNSVVLYDYNEHSNLCASNDCYWNASKAGIFFIEPPSNRHILKFPWA